MKKVILPAAFVAALLLSACINKSKVNTLNSREYKSEAPERTPEEGDIPPTAPTDITGEPSTRPEALFERSSDYESGALMETAPKIGGSDGVFRKEESGLKAGTLTAGEINDFSKWDLWSDLTETAFDTYRSTWGFSLKERYSVQLVFENGIPAVDVEVRLIDPANAVVYTAKTDNTGKAELWANMIPNNQINSNQKYKAVVNYEGKAYSIPKLQAFPNGINPLTINKPCKLNGVLDIAFVVDATGSMGDEINYLKTELYDVINRVKSENPSVKMRTGAVFYRDHGDAYLTRISHFSNNASATIDFIKEQGANGGGDFPEAVDEALDAALNQLSWSTNARGRILFLILDAPPHQNQKTLNKMQNLVKKAASMGVRIIPITGSGINKDVEFLMRSIALATNGTYTFLTNHSGVGGNHIEPTTDQYDVEKLNDLMVRLINRYATSIPCKEIVSPNDTPQTVINPIDTVSQNSSNLWLKCYPNPSSGPINFEVNRGGGLIFIYDNNGKLVARIDMEEEIKHTTDISQLVSGLYYVVYEWNGSKTTQRLVLRTRA